MDEIVKHLFSFMSNGNDIRHVVNEANLYWTKLKMVHIIQGRKNFEELHSTSLLTCKKNSPIVCYYTLLKIPNILSLL